MNGSVCIGKTITVLLWCSRMILGALSGLIQYTLFQLSTGFLKFMRNSDWQLTNTNNFLLGMLCEVDII